MGEELRECPFCGKTPTRGAAPHGHGVICGTPPCPMFGQWIPLEMWNSCRVVESALRARVAELERRNAELVDMVAQAIEHFTQFDEDVLTPAELAAAGARMQQPPLPSGKKE